MASTGRDLHLGPREDRQMPVINEATLHEDGAGRVASSPNRGISTPALVPRNCPMSNERLVDAVATEPLDCLCSSQIHGRVVRRVAVSRVSNWLPAQESDEVAAAAPGMPEISEPVPQEHGHVALICGRMGKPQPDERCLIVVNLDDLKLSVDAQS